MHHAEVVEGDVRELRAARALTHRPHSGRRGGQMFIHRDVAGVRQLDPGLLQTDAAGVRRAAHAHQQVGPLDGELAVRPVGDDAHVTAGFAVNAADLSLQVNGDPLVAEQVKHRRADIGVFTASQSGPPLDDGHPRAEPAHGLRQLQPGIAAA